MQKKRAMGLLALTLTLALAHDAEGAKRAKVVDGIVAFVGQHAVLLSELRQRMTRDGTTDAKQVVQRLVDERAIEHDAREAGVTSTGELLERDWIEVRVKPRLRPGMTLDVARRKRLDEVRRNLGVEILL